MKVSDENRCICGGDVKNEENGWKEHEKSMTHILWMEHQVQDYFERIKTTLNDFVEKQNTEDYEYIYMPREMQYKLNSQKQTDMQSWKYIECLLDYIKSTNQQKKFNDYVENGDDLNE